jgi:hypothetical protein
MTLDKVGVRALGKEIKKNPENSLLSARSRALGKDFFLKK